ncbi:MAG: class I SAM-dependent methyltransferase, partial [Calditrichaeota bacterium]
VYTLPPNQAVSPERQRLINARRNQQPPYRDTRALILRKSRSLLRHIDESLRRQLHALGASARFLTTDARSTPEIPSQSVDLIVTSPPFLNVVQYAADNWLRCWFNHIDAEEVARRITQVSRLEEWLEIMEACFREFYRIVKPGGWIAFEVGEVRNGRVRLDEHVAPIGEKAGFRCQAIVINRQQFTKTSNIWGVQNNRKGTNTNRVVLFRK